MNRAAMVLVAGLALAGCVSAIETPVEPATDVFSTVSSRMPGKYLLVIKADSLAKEIVPPRYHCDRPGFSLDANQPFAESVQRTVGQLVETVEVGPAALPADQLRARGYTAQIIVESGDFTPRLSYRAAEWPSYWFAASTATVDIGARLRVEGANGAVARTSVAAERTAVSDMGWACEDAADTLSLAAHRSLAGVMSEMGLRLKALSAGNGGQNRWEAGRGGGSMVAATLRDRTVYYGTVVESGNSAAVVDYYDSSWRMIRREGLCETPGQWAIRKGAGGDELCVTLAGANPVCYRLETVGDTLDLHDARQPDGPAALRSWRVKTGNAEGFSTEKPHCDTAVPY